jgi:hypothetical protein
VSGLGRVARTGVPAIDLSSSRSVYRYLARTALPSSNPDQSCETPLTSEAMNGAAGTASSTGAGLHGSNLHRGVSKPRSRAGKCSLSLGTRFPGYVAVYNWDQPKERGRRKVEKLFDSQGTLGLFLMFFIPGFITLKVYDLLVPGEARDFSKSLFDAVAYSSLNFAALLWLIGIVRSGSLPPWLWYTAMFVILIGMPAVWPAVFL